MSLLVLWVILCAIAYLIGSIPFGYLAGKLIHRKDIRQGGSGNIGATNALRQYGVKTALLVMALDIAKGFLVAWLLYNVVQDKLYFLADSQPMDTFVFLLPALMVILGHMYSIFLGFKGGKGVATAAGVFLVVAPIPTLFAMLVFVVVTAITRYVSVGSIAAAISLPILVFLWNWYALSVAEFPWFTLVVATLIIYKHNANILRLLEKKENKISFRKKGDS